MRKILFIYFLYIPLLVINAQTQKMFSEEYEELDDPALTDQAVWNKQTDGLHFAWGTTDMRYAKKDVPVRIEKSGTMKLSGWKGEKLNAQFVMWSKEKQDNITFVMSDLEGKKGTVIPARCISAGFVRYVMTDELNKDGKGGCGHRPDRTLFDSLLVADAIDVATRFDLKEQNTCPVWVTVKVPQEVIAGLYKGAIEILRNGKKAGMLSLQVNVVDRTLPKPSDWKFYLDLWQNPYAVSRYYRTGEWTKEHFDAMRPFMQTLADAGQKVITATIMHRAWGGQTYDEFRSMVTWIKRYDGTWEFKYDVFDAWVEFMMSLGIDKHINCYSMIPWSMEFRYFDQKTDKMQVLKTKPGEKEYDEVWMAMLTSFSKHLREKGWFEKTCIAMDERPLDTMKKVMALIRKADKDFKISFAGVYHAEIEPEIFNYCIAPDQLFPWERIEKRNAEGKVTTYYTCCTEPKPNTFTFSAPAEATWIGFYAARLHMDGYLRWAYNSWVEQPLQDSRFRTWAAGDTYLVYPGCRSSIRFERLIEGIQQCEKIFILKEEYKKAGKVQAIRKLDKQLKMFDIEQLKQGASPEEMIEKMKKTLNR